MHLNILGIRGIPASHGGFETFAMHFAQYLVAEGWGVTVYCQSAEGVSRPQSRTDEWNGIERVHFETRTSGTLATMEFDLMSTLHVLRRPGVDLVLGYNTAVFCLLQRLWRRPVAMNMDGIEWQRQKWGRAAKMWFRINEWIGLRAATLTIADHPDIAAHLAGSGGENAVIIPYGSETILDCPADVLADLGLEQDRYFISIARIEPENSILEIVESFVASGVPMKLVVLGNFKDGNPYHDRVRAVANDSVVFPGAIYAQDTLRALRFHCRAYLHGHQVGGTNPSLVEALGAGNAVIAHDNRFNRWVAGDEHFYFHDPDSRIATFRKVAQDAGAVDAARAAARRRHAEAFTFEDVHGAYRDHLVAMASEAKGRVLSRVDSAAARHEAS